MIITTLVDDNYLNNVTKYLLLSLAKEMPGQRLIVFVINSDQTERNQRAVSKWNPWAEVVNKSLTIPTNRYKAYMYVAMTFCFDWILNDSSMADDIVYLDGDTIVRKCFNLEDVVSSEVELSFRLHPFRRIPGPLSDNYGGIMNNGFVFLKNSESGRLYASTLRKRVEDFLSTGLDPIRRLENEKLITCVDQELMFITYFDMRSSIVFEPLKGVYNDTRMSDFALIWHGKGVERNNPRYVKQCRKLAKESVGLNLILKAAKYRFKSYVKRILKVNRAGLNIEYNGKGIAVLKNSGRIYKFEKVYYYIDPIVFHRNKNNNSATNAIHKFVLLEDLPELIKVDILSQWS